MAELTVELGALMAFAFDRVFDWGDTEAGTRGGAGISPALMVIGFRWQPRQARRWHS